MKIRIKNLVAASAVVVGMAMAPSVASAALPTGTTMGTATYTNYLDAQSALLNWANTWGNIFSALPSDTYSFSTLSMSGITYAGVTVPGFIFGQFATNSTASSTLAANFIWSGNYATFTNPVYASTPVPGPIAGAGLPILLGLAGFAAYRRRQTV